MQQKFTATTYTLEILHHIGALENSIHFIFDHKSRKCAVVDPAWEADLLINTATKNNYQLSDIWLTHWHPDHTNAADEVADKTGATITAGVDEVDFLNLDHPIKTVSDGDTISIGATNATIISTPGHTNGGVCYLLDGHLIAGDTLFIYGAGHCALPGADARQFYASMQKLKQLDDDILLHSGHDYGAKTTTTMGEQKCKNPFLMIDNEADFVHYRNHIHDKSRNYPMQPMSQTELNTLLEQG